MDNSSFLLVRTFSAVFCFFQFILHFNSGFLVFPFICLGTFGPFSLLLSFVSCACLYSEHDTAGEPDTFAGVSGCWRVEGALQGARSPFSWLGVACASRNEGCMNGLSLAPIRDLDGVCTSYKGRSGLQYSSCVRTLSSEICVSNTLHS